MQTSHFDIPDYRIQGVNNLIENHGLDRTIDFYLDVLMECLISNPDEKYRYNYIYETLNYLSLKL